MADYLPSFMRDFHDQKDLFKAFYVWLEMMDNRAALEHPRSINPTRRADMASWMDCHVLVVSFLDYMRQMGYQLYPVRGKAKEGSAHPGEMVLELNKLRGAWAAMLYPNEHPALLGMKPEDAPAFIRQWTAWLAYMPPTVVAALEREHELATAPDGDAP